MVAAGIDLGAKTTKVVIFQDGSVVSRSLALSGFDQLASAEKALEEALEAAHIKREDLEHIVATGAGKSAAEMADGDITEVSAAAKGAAFLHPSTRTVVDVGAEEGRAMKCDSSGKVLDFAINEKCAAGAGAFTEAMARALEIDLEELGKLSLQSTKEIPMNAQCVVFAESEVVTLIHAKTDKADIARAVHDGIASRISGIIRKVGIEKDVTLIGGVAKNPGFVESLSRELELDVVVPDYPEYVGAVGAALFAEEGSK